jgi:hypothetical protein
MPPLKRSRGMTPVVYRGSSSKWLNRASPIEMEVSMRTSTVLHAPPRGGLHASGARGTGCLTV